MEPFSLAVHFGLAVAAAFIVEPFLPETTTTVLSPAP